MSAPHCATCGCGDLPQWDKERNQDAECVCGHPYYRHFDTYDDMVGIGCKYCMCGRFAYKLKLTPR